MSDHYCVVGNPIEHSLSPNLHRLFAEQTGEDIHYEKVLVEVGDFNRHIRDLINQGVKGLNVTLPFKEDAFAFVDDADEATQLAKALNTIVVQADGTTKGYSTDGIGLVRDLTRNLEVELQGKRVCLLGAGGAAKSVVVDLVNAGISGLVIANRTVEKAHAIADQVDAQACAFEELTGHFSVVINATSASVTGDALPLPTDIINDASFCYDMMYNKGETAFLKWANAQGARSSDGLGMLVEQGAESFRLWRGVMPETRSVLVKLRS